MSLSTGRIPLQLRWLSRIKPKLKDIKEIQHEIISQQSSDNENLQLYRSPMKGLTYYRTRNKTEKPNIQVVVGSKYATNPRVTNERLRMYLENHGDRIRKENNGQSLMGDVLPRLAVETSSLVLNDSSISIFKGPHQSSQYIAEAIAHRLDRSIPIEISEKALFGMEIRPMQRILTETARQLGYQLNELDGVWGEFDDKRAMLEAVDHSYSLDNSIILSSGFDDRFEGELHEAFQRHHIASVSRKLIEPVMIENWQGGTYQLNDSISHLISEVHPQRGDIHHGIFYPIPSEGEIILNQNSKDGRKFLQSLIMFEWIMGSASAFTTGGPGVGLTSWLYQNILSKPGVSSVKATVDMSMTYPGLLGIISSHYRSPSVRDFENSRQRIKHCLDNIEQVITPEIVTKILKQIRMRSMSTTGLEEIENMRRLFLSNELYSLDDALEGICDLSADEIVSILKRKVFKNEPLEVFWK